MITASAVGARRVAVLAGFSRGWIETRHMLTDPPTLVWYIAVDREDGTLLRAKATPNGMIGYLVGKIVMFALTNLVGLVLLVIPALTVAGDLLLGPRTWLLLALVFVLGMVSTVPVSVALGSLVKSAAQTGLLFLASMLLIIPSGIFYPITALPTWLQWVGQGSPFYWLGLGARSAMLPGVAAARERIMAKGY
jgi:ABC-2 type transport system permease protein